MTTPFEEEIHTTEDNALNPSAMALKSSDMEMLKQSLEQLPAEFREVIVLRDLEEFSYKQIADVINIPLGTVMSRPARAQDGPSRIWGAGWRRNRELTGKKVKSEPKVKAKAD